jgi:hypothetical protein
MPLRRDAVVTPPGPASTTDARRELQQITGQIVLIGGHVEWIIASLSLAFAHSLRRKLPLGSGKT